MAQLDRSKQEIRKEGVSLIRTSAQLISFTSPLTFSVTPKHKFFTELFLQGKASEFPGLLRGEKAKETMRC